MKKIHPYFKKVLKHIVIWTIAFCLFNFLREYGQVVEDGLSARLTMLELMSFQLMLGIVAGALFGSYAYLIDKFLSRRFSFGRTVLISSVGYILVIMCLILIAFTLTTVLIDTSLGKEDFSEFYKEWQP